MRIKISSFIMGSALLVFVVLYLVYASFSPQEEKKTVPAKTTYATCEVCGENITETEHVHTETEPTISY